MFCNRLVPLAAMTVLAGCAATGTQLSQSAALQFKEGQSTEAEVIAKLGPPTSTVVSGGMKTLVYTGGQYQVKPATFIPIVGAMAGGADYSATSAVYQFDSAGVLVRASYSSTGSGSRMGVTPAPQTPSDPRAVK
jgi:20S proteasome alpha/beta subunit